MEYSWRWSIDIYTYMVLYSIVAMKYKRLLHGKTHRNKLKPTLFFNSEEINKINLKVKSLNMSLAEWIESLIRKALRGYGI